jgi:hypothetical protein
MKQLVIKRGMALIAAAAVAVIGACSDAGTGGPGLAGPNASNGPKTSNGDTSKTGGGGGGDSTARKPVAKFTLNVHVGTRRGGTDTLATDPVPGATVSVYEETYTFVHGSDGNDTVHINTTVVATGISDASGNVTFPDLRGESNLGIKADPPAGSPLHWGALALGQTFVDPRKVSLTLLHQ